MIEEELPSLDDMHDDDRDVDTLRKDCAKWRAKYAVLLVQLVEAHRRIDELQAQYSNAMIELDATHAAVDYSMKSAVVVEAAKKLVAGLAGNSDELQDALEALDE